MCTHACIADFLRQNDIGIYIAIKVICSQLVIQLVELMFA